MWTLRGRSSSRGGRVLLPFLSLNRIFVTSEEREATIEPYRDTLAALSGCMRSKCDDRTWTTLRRTTDLGLDTRYQISGYMRKTIRRNFRCWSVVVERGQGRERMEMQRNLGRKIFGFAWTHQGNRHHRLREWALESQSCAWHSAVGSKALHWPGPQHRRQDSPPQCLSHLHSRRALR
ncbi:hypothetical protein FA13DRAFT_242252 [Coprinellus micaceus]|uniref:Uncharacterized protein n=1 Tax=Coprinellus micaceus TaxID=71717 RepID=A0A4Y7SF01_COPMI|nr:hypothetical protein FA13DRAFT_242252 [Coprinellus micaceus]